MPHNAQDFRRQLDWRTSRTDGRQAPSPLRRPVEDHVPSARRLAPGRRRGTERFALPDYIASAIATDATCLPRANSALPAHAGEIEQSTEFVQRYFAAQGRAFPTAGQPYTFLMTGRDHLGRSQPAFERHLNGGLVPPQAGDILVAKGPRPGQLHTALVTRVDAQGVHVLQANVPRHWAGGRQLTMAYALERCETFMMPPLPLAARGHGVDHAVIGWIRPTGSNALPAAAL